MCSERPTWLSLITIIMLFGCCLKQLHIAYYILFAHSPQLRITLNYTIKWQYTIHGSVVIWSHDALDCIEGAMWIMNVFIIMLINMRFVEWKLLLYREALQILLSEEWFLLFHYFLVGLWCSPLHLDVFCPTAWLQEFANLQLVKTVFKLSIKNRTLVENQTLVVGKLTYLRTH